VPARERARPRRGAILIIAMLCLVLAMMLVAALLRLVETQRRQLRHEQAGLQAGWLAESGCDRAAARLSANPDYTGETWSIAPAELNGADPATVVITVQRIDNEPTSRWIRVEALFPADSQPSIRRTRQATIVLFQES
jgi:Tfp pilus assembly protein PilX